MNEVLVFCGFYALILIFHLADKHMKPVHLQKPLPHHVAAVVAGAAHVVTHPTLLEALREYAVHFVVYSGHVIPVH